MSEDRERRADAAGLFTAEERELRELLREAGPRPALPAEDLAATESVVRAAWRSRYERRGAGGRRLWPALAAAAALALAIGLAWRAGRSQPAVPVARIERLAGAVRVDAGSAPAIVAAAGRPLPAGIWIETSEGSTAASWLALRLTGGASLRVDRGARLRLAAANRVELERGAVYVDSGAACAAPIDVVTPAASFREVGTQFEVRVIAEPSGLSSRLRIREGRVAVEAAGRRAIGAAGEELRVAADGRITSAPAARSGSEWSWVLAAAPALDIEGRSVREYLDWFARETGWEVELVDAETRERVERTLLHGSIAHLAVEATPEVVLPSAGLAAERGSGRLRVATAAERRLRTPR